MDDKAGWVPIHPMQAQEYRRGTNGKYDENTREMMPLGLAWGWTNWKSQGTTIDHKLVINLGKKESEHGLTYVAFSRARRLSDIGIVGDFTKTRFINSVRDHKKMKPRQVEEARLRAIAVDTRKAVEAWRLANLEQAADRMVVDSSGPSSSSSSEDSDSSVDSVAPPIPFEIELRLE